MGLFERMHLSEKTHMTPAEARVVVCTAKGQWNPHPSDPADRREGRLHRRSKCGLEKSAIPSRLIGIVNLHKPTLWVGPYSPVKILGLTPGEIID